MKWNAVEDRIQNFILGHEAAGTLPPASGIAAAVVRGDDVFTGTYGLRERDRHLPVTPETLFEIGSLTKAFTAAAVLLASEERKVDLDRPVNSDRVVLPLRDEGVQRQLSISDILSHRTGFPANDLLWYLGAARGRSLRQVISGLESVPGGFRNTFGYNNIMYGILGDLFPEFFGRTWEQTVKERILKPLQMGSTFFGLPDNAHNVSLPYVGTRCVPRADASSVAPAGGLFSTLDDMTRWVRCLLSGGVSPSGEHILTTRSVDLMHKTHMAVTERNPLLFQGLEWLGNEIEYGLGWFLGSHNGVKAAFHMGLIDGYSALLLLVPEKKAGFVVLMNLNLSGFPGLLIQELWPMIVSPDQAAVRQAGDDPHPAHNAAADGEYTNDVYGTIRVSSQSGKAKLEFNGRSWPVTWKSTTTADFTLTAFGLDIPFTADFRISNGRADEVAIPFSLDPRVKPAVFSRRSG